MSSLLAVDIGLKTGLALYGRDGRLVWYRSQNFATLARLRRGARGVLEDVSNAEWLVLEGGGPVAEAWKREAERRSIRVLQISADDWREQLLYARERRNGPQAKHNADEVARRVIEWSRASRPTSLRHDAAEAILVGLWGVMEVGWLSGMPEEIRRRA